MKDQGTQAEMLKMPGKKEKRQKDSWQGQQKQRMQSGYGDL